MKVVLFCGGLGTRLREHSGTVPKPLVGIGHRPIIWHLMRFYAHHGHTDFILCLGYGGDLIKEYFLHYNEAMSNNFTLSDGGRSIDLHGKDIEDWKITFVDSGMNSNLGQRLLAVKSHLKDEDAFLANYSDGLSDVPVNQMIEELFSKNAIASFLAVKPPHSFHCVEMDADGYVTDMSRIENSSLWINGGFFVLSKEIFNYIRPGEELVEKPFDRLLKIKKLVAKPYSGYWKAMDTLKDKMAFDRSYARGEAPWQVWVK